MIEIDGKIILLLEMAEANADLFISETVMGFIAVVREENLKFSSVVKSKRLLERSLRAIWLCL